MKTLKVSHSIIAAWKAGKFEDAVAYYLGKDIPATPAMELGKLYDERWTKYINDNGKLPDELGGGELSNPRTQIKYQLRIPFSDDYDILLRGIPDLTEAKRITDFKCGRQGANNYMSKMQLDYYSLFLPEAIEGVYRCFNPYTKTTTVGVKYLGPKNRDNALNEILTYGSEILQYLLANRLFKDYNEIPT